MDPTTRRFFGKSLKGSNGTSCERHETATNGRRAARKPPVLKRHVLARSSSDGRTSLSWCRPGGSRWRHRQKHVSPLELRSPPEGTAKRPASALSHLPRLACPTAPGERTA